MKYTNVNIILEPSYRHQTLQQLQCGLYQARENITGANNELYDLMETTINNLGSPCCSNPRLQSFGID